ncbi:MAG: PLP-dependent aminotransferase family protein [Ruminiclostridium sp.]|nr:PLP-dependent aminotransferase family protein [Ruminiclostridium sp.]
MLLSLDRNSPEPLYIQIKKQLRVMIEKGSLPPGYCLPPERKLAQSLGVNRTTVLNAFKDLKAEGYLSSHVGQGTVVCRPVPSSETEAFNPLPLSWRHVFNQNTAAGNVTRDLLAVAGQKDMISFAAGIAIPDLNPVTQIQEVWNIIHEKYGASVYQHVPTEGLTALRQSVCSLSGLRGIKTTEQETMILSGSQQGLDLLARLFISPGDTVVMEEPSFFCARQIFEACGARIVGIPVEENGMSMTVLESVLKRLKPKFIYTIPTFHNPTGTVMSLQKRQDLLRLAYRYHLPIVEDDAYGELRYDGEKVPPLKALDNHGYVIYLSTFSKVLFMGLRIGWLHAPAQVIQRLSGMKQLADLHTNSLSQYILDVFIRKKYYEAHLKCVLSANKKRRDAMHEALVQYAPENIPLKWTIPEGGLYFWLKLPDSIPMSRFHEESVRNGVVFVPDRICCLEEPLGNHIRLNFTYPAVHRISEGIRKLMETLEILYHDSEKDAYQTDNYAPIL